MEIQNERTCQDQLQELRKEFDEFSYIISHDLKAPVRAINNLSVWIEEDLGESIPQDVQKNMNLLRSRASRLELMIEALLKYSRISTLQPVLEETDVRQLIEAAIKSVPPTKTIIVQAPDSLPVFKTYKEFLSNILNQIIQNTAFFGIGEKLIIAISVKEEQKSYLFEIADNGSGVPEEALDKIFKLFYTVAPKDAVNTTGAGLTISKRMVNAVGGEMWAQNNTLGGLSVFLNWPKEVLIS